MYNAKEKRAQVYCMKKNLKFETFSQWINSLKNQEFFKRHKSAIATIFLESNLSSSPISFILYKSNYKLYWKNSNLVYISDILQIVQEKVKPGGKFAGILIKEINNELEFYFPTTEQLSTKILKIFCKSGFQRFENVTKIRSNQLVSNNKDHMPIALMENIGLPNELYRRIDCILVVKENKKNAHVTKPSSSNNLSSTKISEEIKSLQEELEICEEIEKTLLELCDGDKVSEEVSFCEDTNSLQEIEIHKEIEKTLLELENIDFTCFDDETDVRYYYDLNNRKITHKSLYIGCFA
ncbi:hypothetical protein Glove_174g111 [Diversispora epigaea]|uniref:Uncharacterized protein n=1 Tax=Diversispora epigaea TaxID=1348612 RepID=A0A397IRQ1_9GLOM|nr:hypothetical protein Glove_174g111 [Diversispora epigaea]